MNIDMVMKYEHMEERSGCSDETIVICLEASQCYFPKAVYSLELGDGVVADNTNEEWNGFAYPSFSNNQRENLLSMLNNIPELKTVLRNDDLVIYNDASGETEVIECRDGSYKFPGWCFFKFGEHEIKSRIDNGNWDIDDVVNFFLWLDANTALINCGEQSSQECLKSFELLSKLTINSITQSFDEDILVLIDKFTALSSLFLKENKL